MATILTLLLSIALVGALVWLILQIPMPPVFKNIIIGVAVIVLIIWLLNGGLGLVNGHLIK